MQSEVVDVSVVMACRNGGALIGRQLEALARQDFSDPWELVVADNGSTDDTAEVVARYVERLPRLRLVDASGVPGAAHARNVGVAAASGSRIAFCDHDDEVDPGWLRAMAAALAEHPLVTATVETARLNPSWVRTAEHRQTLHNTDPPFLPYAYSAALGVRRDLHLAIGGYDESFRLACEDRDYCYRMQLRGEQLFVSPDAVVSYRLRDDLRGIFRQQRAYACGNVQLYVKYRDAGMRKPSQLRALRTWLLLLPRLVLSWRTQRARAQWAQRAGWKVGRLQGSIRHRVVAL